MPALSLLAPTTSETRGPDADDALDVCATEQAIDDYERTHRFYWRFRRLADDRPEMAKWANVAQKAMIEAERTLIMAILTWAPEVRDMDVFSTPHRHHPGRGVRLGSKLYLAMPRPDSAPGDRSIDHAIMALHVIDTDAIHLLDVK